MRIAAVEVEDIRAGVLRTISRQNRDPLHWRTRSGRFSGILTLLTSSGRVTSDPSPGHSPALRMSIFNCHHLLRTRIGGPSAAQWRDCGLCRSDQPFLGVQRVASEVLLEPGDDPILRRCVVNLDSIESVSVGLPVERHGRLSDARVLDVSSALAVAINCC